jgi:hypothetical protein
MKAIGYISWLHLSYDNFVESNNEAESKSPNAHILQIIGPKAYCLDFDVMQL